MIDARGWLYYMCTIVVIMIYTIVWGVQECPEALLKEAYRQARQGKTGTIVVTVDIPDSEYQTFNGYKVIKNEPLRGTFEIKNVNGNITVNRVNTNVVFNTIVYGTLIVFVFILIVVISCLFQ